MSMTTDNEVKNGRIFISAATGEFGALRLRLAGSLQRSGFEAEHQDIFPNTDADTVRKLADLVKGSVLVIHIVGHKPGSIANKEALKDLLHNIPADSLLPEHPELHKALGDFSDITYTQWEAFFALHFGIPLLVYAPADAWDEESESVRDDFPQKEHLARLKIARKYPEWCADEAGYFEKILPDVTRKLGIPVEPITQKIDPPKFLRHTAENFLGREEELAFLDDAWDNSTELVNVLSMIAWGGVGKTSLLLEWIQRRFIAREWKDETGEPELWRYFDWSFYEQGTTSDDDDATDGKVAVRTGSVGDFFEVALEFFGDPDPNLPGKGARLARLVQQQRSLLILDGMEPLQRPFNHPQAGQLIDNDLHALLCALALKNPGLCVVTSRQPLTDLAGLRAGASKERMLSELPVETAIRLLRNLQITGTDEELEEASEAFGRHALSLTLLGRFLYDAHGGDIRKRDLIDLQDADEATRPDRNRTAWKVLEVYDAWLASATGRPEELAALRLTGLFDRPANSECLAALRAEPVIPGLTDALVGLSDSRWNILLNRLERAHLIALRQEDNGNIGIDAHPLIREYFSNQLRATLPEAFKTAHSRLFIHLFRTVDLNDNSTIGVTQLFQSIAHGCAAGRHREACDDIFYRRVRRNGTFSPTADLGMAGAELEAISHFFDSPWDKVSPNIRKHDQRWIIGEASHLLRAVGRGREALEASRKSYFVAKKDIFLEDFHKAVIASGLSDLEAENGNLKLAYEIAKEAKEYAESSESAFQILARTSTVADQLFSLGKVKESQLTFELAESIQADYDPKRYFLYSHQGFNYCNLLLAGAERLSWAVKERGHKSPISESRLKEAIKISGKVTERCKKILEWITERTPERDIAFIELTLARSLFFGALLSDEKISPEVPKLLESALSRFRKSNHYPFLMPSLFFSAYYVAYLGKTENSAYRLDEAQQIAERGPMPLYLADVHLHRARLFRDKSELKLAAELIHKHEYGRRYEELADAEAASASW